MTQRRRNASYHIDAEVTPSAAAPAKPDWLSMLGGVPVTFILTFFVTPLDSIS